MRGLDGLLPLQLQATAAAATDETAVVTFRQAVAVLEEDVTAYRVAAAFEDGLKASHFVRLSENGSTAIHKTVSISSSGMTVTDHMHLYHEAAVFSCI